MISTHDYTAVLIGSPDETLSIKGGRITLDEGSSPHVTAELEISPPVAAVLTALDPRTGARVRITADAEFPTYSTTRTFDLGVRRRPVSHDDSARVLLSLASDEMLLEDHRALAEDGAPRALGASLRAVCNYVLDKAIPGASLEATPANDFDVTPYTDAVNLSPNGGFRTALTGWVGGPSFTRVAGGPSGSGVDYYAHSAWASSGTGGVFNSGGEVAGATAVTVTAGDSYTSSLWVRANVAATVALSIEWVDASSAFLSTSPGTPVALPANTWVHLKTTAIAPAGAARAGTFCYRSSGTWVSGNTFDVGGHRFSPTPADPYDPMEFFDSATPDTPGYDYALSGTTSTRTALIDRDPEMLKWRSGESAMDFLHPLVQVAGFRLVCDEERKWTLRSETYNAGGDTLTIAHGVNLISAEDDLTVDDGLWFDAQVTRYRWTDSDGVQHEQSDTYALTMPPKRVNLVEVSAPYLGPGRSEYAVNRAQGRGREVSATTVADWRVKAEQTVQIILEPPTPVQVGETSRIEFSLDTDRMTITTRTTDVLPGSIDLLTGTIDSLVGTIDAL